MTEKDIKTKSSKPVVHAKKERYFESVGRRKEAVARVRLFPGKHENSGVTVNDKKLDSYFPIKKHQIVVISPINSLSLKDYSVSAKVEGGGVSSQAEAVRLGIARNLVALNPIWRSRLKSLGFLTRDPRMVERKKPGLRKARRPQQWRKR